MKKPYEGHEIRYKWLQKEGILSWGSNEKQARKGQHVYGEVANY